MDDAGASLQAQMSAMGRGARAAAVTLRLAAAVRADAAQILAANARDVADAQAAGLTPAMIDRLLLDPARVEAMAKGLETVAALRDPLGAELDRWDRPNGLDIARIRTPIGVI